MTSAFATNGDDVLVADLSSTKYGLQSIISALPVGLAANQGDLRALGTIASGLLAIVILVLSVLMPRREPG